MNEENKKEHDPLCFTDMDNRCYCHTPPTPTSVTTQNTKNCCEKCLVKDYGQPNKGYALKIECANPNCECHTSQVNHRTTKKLLTT